VNATAVTLHPETMLYLCKQVKVSLSQGSLVRGVKRGLRRSFLRI
jgi:hypothetical protein